VNKMSFSQMKMQETQSRMAAIRKARRSPAAAAAQQRRDLLVGDGAKWRITALVSRWRAQCLGLVLFAGEWRVVGPIMAKPPRTKTHAPGYRCLILKISSLTTCFCTMFVLVSRVT
jgi:hypothetical protein